jgi:hypothetical protein
VPQAHSANGARKFAAGKSVTRTNSAAPKAPQAHHPQGAFYFFYKKNWGVLCTMRSKIFFFLILISCSSGGNYEKAENAQDAGREFIRATLEGDHKKAKFYLLKDSTNLMLIAQQQQNYNHLSMMEKRQHRESNIRPLNIKKLNDSVTSYQYYTTYNPKDTTIITIVKTGGDWLVDLKSILNK